MDNKEQNFTEIAEEELEGASGGLTKNRYDPKRCDITIGIIPECYGGPLKLCPCDHFKTQKIITTILASCAMGRYTNVQYN